MQDNVLRNIQEHGGHFESFISLFHAFFFFKYKDIVMHSGQLKSKISLSEANFLNSYNIIFYNPTHNSTEVLHCLLRRQPNQEPIGTQNLMMQLARLFQTV